VAQETEQPERHDDVERDHHDVGADADVEQARRFGNVLRRGDRIVVDDERSANGELGEDPRCDDAQVGETRPAGEPRRARSRGDGGDGGGGVHGGSFRLIGDDVNGTDGPRRGSWPSLPTP
jgi:hypothetical protein